MKIKWNFAWAAVLFQAILAVPIQAVERPAFNAPPFWNTSEIRTVEPALKSGGDRLIPEPGRIFSEGDTSAFSLPYLISEPEPVRYPLWAQRHGWQGECVIAVEVLTDGSVGRYQIIHSSGHAILDREAQEAVLSWKFHPAMSDGRPVVECVQIPVRFRLQPSE